MISSSVPHTPTATLSTSTGPSSLDGSGTSLRAALFGLLGMTVTPFTVCRPPPPLQHTSGVVMVAPRQWQNRWVAPRIEDYALIGDLQTAALVGKDGSIDWLCLPRFDSGACFAALLGEEKHGCWRIAPAGDVRKSSRRYREGTLVLETDFETDEGAVRVVDCMLVRKGAPVVVRLVEGLRGTVPMRMQLVVRPDYGSTVPWVDEAVEGLTFLAGPNALYLRTPVETRGEDFTTVGEFSVREDERVPFTLTWGSSHEPAPPAIDPLWAVSATGSWWGSWSSRCGYTGRWHEEVLRSLITLKALTYEPTGGIV